MRRKTSGARGMTLVEILLATFILCAVLLPIGGLIFGGNVQSEQSKSFNIGANMAANVMDALLSAQVPFRAIDPAGGPTVAQIAAAGLLSDPVEAVSRQCASFKPEFSTMEDRVFGSLGTPVAVGNFKRVLEKQAFVFEIYWFAGVYKDRTNVDSTLTAGQKVPDYLNELTFAYFKNPYLPIDQARRRDVVLQGGLQPYTQNGEAYVAATQSIVDPRDPRARPGWPALDSDADGPTYAEVRSKSQNAGVLGLKWPIVFADQEEFNEKDGGLMKITVGVRWGSKTGLQREGPGAQMRTREFWLVSMKGRLEEN